MRLCRRMPNLMRIYKELELRKKHYSGGSVSERKSKRLLTYLLCSVYSWIQKSGRCGRDPLFVIMNHFYTIIDGWMVNVWIFGWTNGWMMFGRKKQNRQILLHVDVLYLFVLSFSEDNISKGDDVTKMREDLRCVFKLVCPLIPWLPLIICVSIAYSGCRVYMKLLLGH